MKTSLTKMKIKNNTDLYSLYNNLCCALYAEQCGNIDVITTFIDVGLCDTVNNLDVAMCLQEALHSTGTNKSTNVIKELSRRGRI